MNNSINNCVSRTHIPTYGALIGFWGATPRPKLTKMGEAHPG